MLYRTDHRNPLLTAWLSPTSRVGRAAPQEREKRKEEEASKTPEELAALRAALRDLHVRPLEWAVFLFYHVEVVTYHVGNR